MTQAAADCLALRHLHNTSVNIAGHLKWQVLEHQK